MLVFGGRPALDLGRPNDAHHERHASADDHHGRASGACFRRRRAIVSSDTPSAAAAARHEVTGTSGSRSIAIAVPNVVGAAISRNAASIRSRSDTTADTEARLRTAISEYLKVTGAPTAEKQPR